MICFNCCNFLSIKEDYPDPYCAECNDCCFYYKMSRWKAIFEAGFTKFGKNNRKFAFSFIESWSLDVPRKVFLRKYLFELPPKNFKIIHEKMVKICSVVDLLEQSSDCEEKFREFEKNPEKYIKLISFC